MQFFDKTLGEFTSIGSNGGAHVTSLRTACRRYRLVVRHYRPVVRHYRSVDRPYRCVAQDYCSVAQDYRSVAQDYRSVAQDCLCQFLDDCHERCIAIRWTETQNDVNAALTQ